MNFTAFALFSITLGYFNEYSIVFLRSSTELFLKVKAISRTINRFSFMLLHIKGVCNPIAVNITGDSPSTSEG